MFEMPLLVTGVENEPITFQIAATIPDTDDTQGLEMYLDYVPIGSRFSRGSQVGDRWIFTPQDFGVVELNLPVDTSGRFDLEITAVASGASRRRSLILDILSVRNTTDVQAPGEDCCRSLINDLFSLQKSSPAYSSLNNIQNTWAVYSVQCLL